MTPTQDSNEPGRPDLSYRSGPPSVRLAQDVIQQGTRIRRRRRAAAGVSGGLVLVGGLTLAAQLLNGPQWLRTELPPAGSPTSSTTPNSASSSSTSIAQPTGTASSATKAAVATGSGGPVAHSGASSHASATSSGAATGSPVPSRCGITDLRIKVASTDGAMGTVAAHLRFTNIGAQTCILYGFPGVSLAEAGGHQLGQDAARRSTLGALATVTLAPGAFGTADFLVADGTGYDPVKAAPCLQAAVAGLRVYPPGSTSMVVVPWTAQVCTGVRPGVSPVKRG